MKKLLLLLVAFSFTGCFWDLPFFFGGDPSSAEPISRYEPVILKRNIFDNSVKVKENVKMTESSKIYVIGNFIFINDKHKGFHIFDNSNPKNPVKKKFLSIPGATDIAIRNGTMFVNQATDLVSLSFDPTNYSIKVNKRVKNVFPKMISPDGYRHKPKKNEVIIDWKLK